MFPKKNEDPFKTKYSIRYMEIPQNSLKPMEFHFAMAKVGESYVFENPKQVQDLILEKLKDGWKYLCKQDTETGHLLYFTKNK